MPNKIEERLEDSLNTGLWSPRFLLQRLNFIAIQLFKNLHFTT